MPLSLLTVYVVVIVGLSVMLAVLALDGVHVYVVPPLAVKVIDPAEHNTEEVVVIDNEGVELIVMVTVLVSVHPEPLSPITMK